jgi:arylsulfatase A-like enzyme
LVLRSPSLRALLAVTAVLSAGPALLSPAKAPPNLLLVTIDTLRSDHVSAYGHPRPTTPVLDALAARGALFETAYCPMPTTGPSHATMFTGVRPSTHGVIKNGLRLPPERATLAELLTARGYRTGGVVSSYPVHRDFGLARGFASYDDEFAEGAPSPRTRVWEGVPAPEAFSRAADRTRARAVAWLQGHGYLRPGSRRLAPFFLWVHFFDPHFPYEPPSEHAAAFPPPAGADETARQRAAYEGEVRFADAELGRLLEALGRAGKLRDTAVVVAGDHGEGLMDHGHLQHGLFLYEEVVRVPFVVHWPGRVVPARRAEPVELLDLQATVLDLLGVPEDAWPRGEGRSLASMLSGGPAPPPRAVLLERRHYEAREVEGFAVRGSKHAIREGRYKYIEAEEEGTRELYDIEADPGERRNLASERPEDAGRLSSLLREWVRERGRPMERVPDGVAERLRALGYVR